MPLLLLGLLANGFLVRGPGSLQSAAPSAVRVVALFGRRGSLQPPTSLDSSWEEEARRINAELLGLELSPPTAADAEEAEEEARVAAEAKAAAEARVQAAKEARLAAEAKAAAEAVEEARGAETTVGGRVGGGIGGSGCVGVGSGVY